MAKAHFISNLCGRQSRYDMAKVSNSRSVNMYPETIDSDQSYVSIAQLSINGCRELVSIDGSPRGMYTMPRGRGGKASTYAVFDNILYLIEAGAAYPIHEIASGSAKCHMCSTGGANPHLILVDSVNVYAVDATKDIIDQQQDFRMIQLPLRAGSKTTRIVPTHCAYLYGYLNVNDAGSDNFYTSYQYPFETNIGTEEEPQIDYDLFRVNSEEFKDYGFLTQSEWAPDYTLAIVSNGSRLFTLGSSSYQVFQYNSDVNNPFTSPDTAAQSIGIRAIDSLAQIGPYTFWFGSSDIGEGGVYMNTGSVECKRVSTIAIEREISRFTVKDDAYAQVWSQNQHTFYCITFPTAHRTFVYDVLEDAWHERATKKPDNTLTEWRYNFATLDRDGHLLFACDGAVVIDDDTRWTEHDGNPIVRLRTGGAVYSNHCNFFLDGVDIVMNNGQCGQLAEGVQAQLTMRYTSDGSSWSDPEIIEVGSQGSYDYDCYFSNFGLVRDFSIELSTTSDFPFTLYGLNVTSEEASW